MLKTFVPDLTKNLLERWLRDLVKGDDDEALRHSKDTANRLWTIMKAALNHAFSDDANRIPTDKAWRTVEPFKKVGKARADHFTEAQVRQLLASAKREDPAFADFLEGHFHAGARPHELSSAEVRHFLTADAQIIVPMEKQVDALSH